MALGSHDECVRKALAALAAMRRLGLEALERLDANDDDGANGALKARMATFHNLRAIDARAQSLGLNVAEAPGAKLLVDQISEIDTRLAPRLEMAKERAQAQMNKVNAARRALGRFKAETARQASATFAHGA